MILGQLRLDMLTRLLDGIMKQILYSPVQTSLPIFDCQRLSGLGRHHALRRAVQKHDKGIFVLVKTSNPSSGELQNLKLEDGRTVYECMGDMVERWGEGTVGKYGYSCVGAVVGATYPEEAKVLRARLPHTFFLVPGYGAQGANAEMLKNCFDANGLGGVVNNSRGVLCAYRKRGGTYDEAARAACLDMRADLQNVLGAICAK